MKITHALMAMIAIIIMVGCSSTINIVSIDAEGSARVKADLSIPTSQDTSGEGAAATQGAAAAVGMVDDLIGKFTPNFSQQTTQPPLQPVPPVVPPLAPPAAPAEEFPQINEPAQPPDSNAGVGNVEEVD